MALHANRKKLDGLWLSINDDLSTEDLLQEEADQKVEENPERTCVC